LKSLLSSDTQCLASPHQISSFEFSLIVPVHIILYFHIFTSNSETQVGGGISYFFIFLFYFYFYFYFLSFFLFSLSYPLKDRFSLSIARTVTHPVSFAAIPLSNDLFPAMSDSLDKGLRNNEGENNCFLNSIIQCLWHLDQFRNSLLESSSLHQHRYSSNAAADVAPLCLTCALSDLFTQYSFSDTPVLPADAVRTLLARLYAAEDRFQLGRMDDAVELLDALLQRIHSDRRREDGAKIAPGVFAAGAPADPMPADRDDETMRCCLAHETFGLRLSEVTRCRRPGCGFVADQQPPNSIFVMYAYVFSLLMKHVEDPELSFAGCVRESSRRSGRPCPRKLAVSPGPSPSSSPSSPAALTAPPPRECGTPLVTDFYLRSAPSVFALGLVWMDSEQCPLDEISSIVKMLPMEIDLDNLLLPMSLQAMQFGHTNYMPRAKYLYKFRGMVCYYGRHYKTYFWSAVSRQWVSFDDARVEQLGPDWDAVVQKCLRGHLQPTVLFYEHVNARAEDANDVVPLRTSSPSDFGDVDFVLLPPVISPPPTVVSPPFAEDVEVVDEPTADLRRDQATSASQQRTAAPSLLEPLSSADVAMSFRLLQQRGLGTAESEDIAVEVINWYYRVQDRVLRFSAEGFCRAIPATLEMREAYLYSEVADVRRTSAGGLVITFLDSSVHSTLHVRGTIENIRRVLAIFLNKDVKVLSV
jgi:hypothetical protein